MAAGTMYPLSLSDLKAITPSGNPNDIYYLTDAGKEGEFFVESSNTSPFMGDDAITVASNNISGTYYLYRRVIEDGVISVRWFGAVGDGTTDDSAAIQNALNTSEGQTITFDFPNENVNNSLPGYYTSFFIDNNTITVPARKVLKFRAGNRITGTGTIDGGIIDAGYDQQIFEKTLTVIPAGTASEMFSVKWFGAKGIGSGDDYDAIQKTIDTLAPLNTVITAKVYFPTGHYPISAPLIVSWFFSGSYRGVTMQLIGEGTFWESSTGGSRISCSFKDTFAIGIQNGKNVVVQGLYLTGAFTPPALSSTDFYMTAFDDYKDTTCRDSGAPFYADYSPYSGIVIDPFSNSSSNIPGDGGYPGLTSYYQGAGGSGGSTATTIDNCFIANFVVGICSSPNTFTRNAELTLISNTQFQFCKLCVSSSHDQEKTCKIIRSACWATTHTFFASRKYGAYIPGQWELDNVQLAGRVNTYVDHDSGGYAASAMKNCFAESLGKFGIWKSSVGSKVQDCEFSFAQVATESFAYNDYYIDSSLSVVFENCVIRIYGTNYPVTLKGGGLYRGCGFESIPYIGDDPYYLDAGSARPKFEDCIANGHPFGPTSPVIIPYPLTTMSGYGKFELYRSDTIGTALQERFLVENSEVDIIVSPPTTTTVTPTITGADRHHTFLVNASELFYFEVGRLLLAYIGGRYNPMGVITAINTGTNQITVTYIAPQIQNGVAYPIAISHPLTVCYPFLGDTTASSDQITNVVGDQISILNLNVGQWIKSTSFVTNTYSPFVRILSYSTGTYTVSENCFYSKTGDYFFNGTTKKFVLEGGNTSLPLSSMANEGTKIHGKVGPTLVTYLVTKAGFLNADHMSDTRQALWKVIEPFAGITYRVITESQSPYAVELEDELLEVDATNGDVDINLQDVLGYVLPGNGGARLLRVKKVDSSANVVNINKNVVNSDQPIDGQATITLTNQYESVTIYQGVSEFGTPGYIQNTGIIN